MNGYRRGTNTYTVTHEAFETEQVLLTEMTATAGTELAARARFSIPTDSMHTFVQTNNRLEWFLEIRVRIAKWPDAAYEFACEVWPYAYVEPSSSSSEAEV